MVTFGAFVVAALLTPAAPSADDCDAWALAGYRIGMTREEALGVRGGTLVKEGRELRPKIEGGGTAVVAFDATGTIDQVSVRSSRPSAEIKLTVSWRIGQPSADGVPLPRGAGDARGEAKQTRWESKDCGSDLLMNAPGGEHVDIPGSDVFLVPHGVEPRDLLPHAPAP